MKIERLMNPDVQTCRPGDSLATAAQKMWTHDIGCLVVTDDNGKPLGMVTDRDILMCAHFGGVALGTERVARAMSKEIHAVQFGQSVSEAEALMKLKQVRRLAVVDRTGKLTGIVSLNDLALAAGPGIDVRPEDVAATLASICQPRAGSATAAAGARAGSSSSRRP